MITPLMRRLPLAALLLALALAGCGASSTANNAKDFKGDQKAVAQTIDDFGKAVRDNDQKTICTDLLARALVQRLDASRQKCTGAISDQLDAAGDTKLDVKTISVTGNRATASVVSKVDGKDRTQTLTLVNESGRWRLSGLSA
jgi:hypothetical protein